MKKRFLLPPIPDSERTPLVIALLGVIEGLAELVQKQDKEIALLKEEIRILKGGKKRPHFKPNKMDEHTEEVRRGEEADQDQRRPGSDKRSKSAELVIHKQRIIQPKRRVPKGSRFKGYRDILIQDLVIRAHNTRYRLAPPTAARRPRQRSRSLMRLPSANLRRHQSSTRRRPQRQSARCIASNFTQATDSLRSSGARRARRWEDWPSALAVF